MALSSVPDILDDIRAGKMVILMDDEDRENEGDLIIAAEAVTPEVITFFSSEACGLICMPITKERAQQLQLPLMVRDGRSAAPRGPYGSRRRSRANGGIRTSRTYRGNHERGRHYGSPPAA